MQEGQECADSDKASPHPDVKGVGEQEEGNNSRTNFEISCFCIGETCNFRGQLQPWWGNGKRSVSSQHITTLVVHLLHLLKRLVNAGHAASTVHLCLTWDEGLEPCRLTQERHCASLDHSFVLNTFLYHRCIILLLRLPHYKIWNQLT